MANTGVGEINQALRHTTGGHERPGEQEERNGQEGVGVRGFKQLDRQRTHRVLAEHQDRHGAGQAQGNRNRHAEKHEHEQQQEQTEHGHQ